MKAFSFAPSVRVPKRVVRASYSGSGGYNPSEPLPVEKKNLKKWLESGNIFDIAALGPRAGLGLLNSLQNGTLPKLISEASSEISEVLASPAPPNEKPVLLAQSWEDRLARFVEVGEVEEQKILQQVETVLPAEVRQAIPAPWPSSARAQAPVAGSSMDTYVPTQQTMDSIGVNNAAAEMLQLQMSVSNVRQALEALSQSSDPGKEKMLRLNAREARDMLQRRLREISPVTRRSEDPAVQSAIREAEAFLAELAGITL